jgi:phosphate transport system substrate-binding protein
MTSRSILLRRLLAAAMVLAVSLAFHRAEAGGATPAHYRPHQTVSGTIRIWGDDHMSAVVQRWAEGFRRFHPRIRFETKLVGSGAAMPGIYHGVADLALLGRESDITDDNGFFKSVGGYKPLRLELMNGSADVPGASCAPVVFVHKDNPLRKLTVAQLDAIFSYEHRRGLESIRTWGQLGLGSTWSDKPIRLYAYDIDTEDGLHFARSVLADSRKLNWDHLVEFSDTEQAGGGVLDAGWQMVDALRRDPFGLAVSCGRFAGSGVKPIAIAAHESAPYVLGSATSIVSRTYPLARRTYAFLNQRPGQPIDPKLREFLRYVLSQDGQQDVARSNSYLPLSPEVVAEQVRLLQ